MMWHHLMYDVRYIFRYDAFEFFESYTFQEIIHPLILIGFFMAAGISQSFSRNNLQRFKKIGGIALLLTIVTTLISYILRMELYMIWQILHSIAFCILLTHFVQKVKSRRIRFSLLLFISILLAFILPMIISHYDLAHNGTSILMPFGIGYLRPGVPSMLDYIPVVPLGGFFFIGVLLGEILYPNRKITRELFVNPIWKPLLFLGKKSLWVYAIHQPLFIFIFWLVGRFIR